MKTRVYIRALLVILLLLIIALPASANVGGGGKKDSPGMPLYVIIEMYWDGESPDMCYDLWGPMWGPPEIGGEYLGNYCEPAEWENFQLKGGNLHFDEVLGPDYEATPPKRHVVLADSDGDGVFTGSLPFRRWTFEGVPNTIYGARTDFWITWEDGQVTDFYSIFYEYKKVQKSATK
jgi:hypothetical protein